MRDLISTIAGGVVVFILGIALGYFLASSVQLNDTHDQVATARLKWQHQAIDAGVAMYVPLDEYGETVFQFIRTKPQEDNHE